MMKYLKVMKYKTAIKIKINYLLSNQNNIQQFDFWELDYLLVTVIQLQNIEGGLYNTITLSETTSKLT